MSATAQGVEQRLRSIGQEHLLHFWDELSEAEREGLVRQIEDLPLERMPELIDRYVKRGEGFELPKDLEPAPYYPHDHTGRTGGPAWDRAEYKRAGERLLAEGKVACFVVAGGQGSRLGYEGPKGCYPTGAVSGKSLFQIFAEQILATGRKYGTPVPWYVLVSPLNHAATVGFFREHRYFGLHEQDVMFITQGVMPAVDKATGKILLAEKGEVATAPDGHGGSFDALVKSGAVADMRGRGVEHISYFQVDNPNVHCVDPVFLGLHATAPDSSGEMSSKMIPKASPAEKVGVFCRVGGAAGGKTAVIEYSDLPEELANQRDEHGHLRFIAGSIAIHAISLEFIERVVNDPKFRLPFHRAVKKVAHVDLRTGEKVEPAEPNAVKMEKFVFDAIPMAERSIVLETDRVEEFAPVKNREGPDSIVTSRQLQTERAARWLAQLGVDVPRTSDGEPDCVLEISPLTALFAEDLAQHTDIPKAIARGARVVI